MNRTNIISSVKILIVALFLSVGVGYIFAWTGPTTTPAGGNAAAPISAGSSAQTKNGPLTLNFDDSAAIGLKVLGQIQMVDGNQASGRVLISDGSGVARLGRTERRRCRRMLCNHDDIGGRLHHRRAVRNMGQRDHFLWKHLCNTDAKRKRMYLCVRLHRTSDRNRVVGSHGKRSPEHGVYVR